MGKPVTHIPLDSPTAALFLHRAIITVIRTLTSTPTNRNWMRLSKVDRERPHRTEPVPVACFNIRVVGVAGLFAYWAIDPKLIVMTSSVVHPTSLAYRGTTPTPSTHRLPPDVVRILKVLIQVLLPPTVEWLLGPIAIRPFASDGVS